ncbi:hypothetical protein HMPREF9444_00924 [Succinatimonas hippei YIT 12066]|uniref:Uncharacterized protein n=1 Tax=Succinatimonas hippei (strain DSM 22608 / JCM 16073 / KCTC 15190 / YIT 12066) TaxID=762983 RepID=E8LJP1_SUCHY|nr:hypothetical protein HMPREF9444_00924 [Succinatimonas hippei YIT 12066]
MIFSVFPTNAAKSQIHAFILHINLVLLFYLRKKMFISSKNWHLLNTHLWIFIIFLALIDKENFDV